jgi:glycosyltransferase involved in cell wall biosynthesis
MRIAIFSEVLPPKIDGITNRLSNTLACLVRAGHQVLAFGPQDAAAEVAGVPVVRVPGPPFPFYPGLRVTLPDPRIARELRRFRADVVHAVGPACLGIWGMLAARTLRLPVVASYHTDLPRYMPEHGLGWLQPAAWPLIRRVHNTAHVNLCPSRHTRRELREHGVEEVGLWRGGVDTELFHPRKRDVAMRARLAGGRPDGPVALFVGRLSPEKNLVAFEWLLEALPRLRVALVGDGPGRKSLERRFAGSRVAFLGALRGEELAAAFASADLFFMPSTTETLGFVVLEAMSSGLPVVAVRAGGIPDLVSDGESGVLYEADRPGDAVEAVRRLLDSPGERRFTAQQARKRAEESSWESETRKLVFEYRKAMVLRRRRGLLGQMARAIGL